MNLSLLIGFFDKSYTGAGKLDGCMKRNINKSASFEQELNIANTSKNEEHSQYAVLLFNIVLVIVNMIYDEHIFVIIGDINRSSGEHHHWRGCNTDVG